jgi:hypothetical protein
METGSFGISSSFPLALHPPITTATLPTALIDLTSKRFLNPNLSFTHLLSYYWHPASNAAHLLHRSQAFFSLARLRESSILWNGVELWLSGVD